MRNVCLGKVTISCEFQVFPFVQRGFTIAILKNTDGSTGGHTTVVYMHETAGRNRARIFVRFTSSAFTFDASN